MYRRIIFVLIFINYFFSWPSVGAHTFKLEQFEKSACDTCRKFWMNSYYIEPFEKFFKRLPQCGHPISCPYHPKSPYGLQYYDDRPYETKKCDCGRYSETHISINLAKNLAYLAHKNRLNPWNINPNLHTLLKRAYEKEIIYKHDTYLYMPKNLFNQIINGRYKNRKTHYRAFKYILKNPPKKYREKIIPCDKCQVALKIPKK